MSEEINVCEESGKAGSCNNRREFFVKAGTIAGGLVLSLSGVPSIMAGSKKDDQADEAVLKIDDKSPLNKVGGYDVIESKAGKVLVIRTGDMSFSAYSASCTHKGARLKYDEKTGQIFCPSHGSRYDAAGAVVKGPATTPLPTYTAQNEVVVTLKPKA